jgi:hypothetical protein
MQDSGKQNIIKIHPEEALNSQTGPVNPPGRPVSDEKSKLFLDD